MSVVQAIGSEKAAFEVIAAAALGAGLLRWQRGLKVLDRSPMRLHDIERGDGVFNRLLISCISLVSRMRLPDAARVAFYHKDFFAAPMGAWTQATMRGPSKWSVSERELMAAMVAKWNSCVFCVGAHGAIARKRYNDRRLMRCLRIFVSAHLRKFKGDTGISGDPYAAAHGTHCRGRKSRAPCGCQHRRSDRCDRSVCAVQHYHAICRRARFCSSNSQRVRPCCEHASKTRVCVLTLATLHAFARDTCRCR